MARAVVAPIVEGHGEQQSAVRSLLSRIWTDIVGGDYLHVLQPIRRPRTKLIDRKELLRAIDLADLKLQALADYDKRFILVLIDADEDLPCVIGPRLQQVALEDRPHLDVVTIVANIEYETWFIGAAESLAAYLDLSAAQPSTDPEGSRQGKGLVMRMTRGRYGETIDQPRFSAVMDLVLCRSRCPSFDKLCRELEKRYG